MNQSDRNRNDQQVEIYDRNSLVAMPDHIIEKIFNSLDFEDKLSFSESCVKFNQIFNSTKNLRNVWLKLFDNQQSVELSRPYENLVWNCLSVKKVSKGLWSNCFPNMTSLRIHDAQLLYSKSLLNALPRFANLSHLDIVVTEKFKRDRLLKSKPRNLELLEMENLEYLRMDCDLFGFLDRHHINFAATKKLQALKICNPLERGYYYPGRFDDMEDTTSKLRALVEAQTNLRILHLIGRAAIEILKLPLNIQSCQLEEFKLISDKFINVPVNHEENICDFIDSLNQLKYLECKLTKEGRTEKIVNFWNRLESFSRTQQMVITDGSSKVKIDILIKEDVFKSEMYYDGRSILRTDEQPNTWTKKLTAKIINSHSRISQIISGIVTKFPNLLSIDINFSDHSKLTQTDCLASLGRLKHLKSLTLHLCSSDCKFLNSIRIPGLKRFDYTENDSFYKNSNDVKINLIDFLNRHKHIQELRFSIKFIFYTSINDISNHDTSIMEIVDCALKNLKNLMFLSIPDRSYDKGPCTNWNKSFPLIIKSANPGFRFKCSSFEIMRRYDDKIVQKFNGKWHLIPTKAGVKI